MKKLFWLMLCMLSLLIVGCGGGGGSSAGASASTAQVNVFAADDLSTNYSHVWATIQKVTLQPGNVVVYSDPVGQTVDLRSLNNGGVARYAFLNRKGVPEGNYTSVEVVLDKAINLVLTGQTTALARTFRGFDTTTNAKTLTFALSRKLGGEDNLVVDFDLANWTEDGTFVDAVVKDGDPAGPSHEDRHEESKFGGTVSLLAGTAPDQTFNLSGEGDRTVGVKTDVNTVIFQGDTTNATTLANGLRVGIKGKWDPVNKVFLALVIRVAQNAEPEKAEADGTATNVDASVGTFTLNVAHAENFLPDGTTVSIATSNTTRFFGSRGTNIGFADAFALLPTATKVEVRGSYDTGTKVLTADFVRVENEQHEHESAKARGPVSNVNAGATSFSLGLVVFEGINRPAGAVISVVAAGDATYSGADLGDLTSTQFFTALGDGAGKSVEVSGTYNGDTQTLTAKKIRLVSASAGGNWASIDGPVTVADTSAHTASITVREWHGADLVAGSAANIVVTGETDYRGANSATITATEFWNLVAAGKGIHAEGPWTASSSTLTARHLRLKDHGDDNSLPSSGPSN